MFCEFILGESDGTSYQLAQQSTMHYRVMGLLKGEMGGSGSTKIDCCNMLICLSTKDLLQYAH